MGHCLGSQGKMSVCGYEKKAQGGEFMSRNPRGRNSMSSPKAVGWMTERKLTPLSLIPGNL